MFAVTLLISKDTLTGHKNNKLQKKKFILNGVLSDFIFGATLSSPYSYNDDRPTIDLITLYNTQTIR